jgi:hypothetical protein
MPPVWSISAPLPRGCLNQIGVLELEPEVEAEVEAEATIEVEE